MIQPPVPAAEYRYWVCDLRTGDKVAQLPLKPEGALPDRICDVATVGFTCDQSVVAENGGDYAGSVTPGRTVVIVEREYEGDSTSDILWAGIVTVAPRGSNPIARLNCATIPYYLDARHVGTHTYSEASGHTDGQIITDLLADAAPEGINLILDVDCPTLRSARYLVTGRTTVLRALRELSEMDGGPEWMITTRWSDATRTSIEFVFQARTRLGWANEPNARFDYPGCVNEYVIDPDYSTGHGANHIIAVTSAGAASTPARDEEAITAQGWARWEQVVSVTRDVDAAGLDGTAREALKQRARGQTTTELVVSLSAGPQYGRDWSLGDNVTWLVEAPLPGQRPASLAHPNGHQEVIRPIGVAIDIPNDSYVPMLWSPYEEASS